MKTLAWAVAASSGLMLLAGCGLAASPQPPTAWLPQPVRDLGATRAGAEVHLHWTMPRNSTDKLALKGEQHAHICWMPPAGTSETAYNPKSCRGAGDGQFAPDKAADFTVHLDPAQTSGAPQAIRFFVLLENHAGKSAGPSNAAWAAAGAAPPPLQGLRLGTRAQGVVLHWQAAAAEGGLVLRIHRTLVAPPHAPRASQTSGEALPPQQTLEVDLDKTDPGQALDRDAALDHTWRYTAERVARVNIAGQRLEIAGPASEAVSIDAKDTFPPQVPAGLAVVSDAQARTIDLSWAPDADADLAGYAVYRRDLADASEAQRVSGTQPLVAPAYEDRAVTPGHRYAYSVSAIDRDGNESARSAEVEEELPQP